MHFQPFGGSKSQFLVCCFPFLIDLVLPCQELSQIGPSSSLAKICSVDLVLCATAFQGSAPSDEFPYFDQFCPIHFIFGWLFQLWCRCLSLFVAAFEEVPEHVESHIWQTCCICVISSSGRTRDLEFWFYSDNIFVDKHLASSRYLRRYWKKKSLLQERDVEIGPASDEGEKETWNACPSQQPRQIHQAERSFVLRFR